MEARGIGAIALVLLGVASAQDPAKAWDFQDDRVDEAPSGFSFGKTGRGRPGKWVIRTDPSAPAGDHVLAQVDTDDTDYRFPVAVADAPVLKDLDLEVHCKQISGNTDEACGLVFRYQDENNYYVVRANALEDNVRLYRVVKGNRRQFAGWNGKVAKGVWHTLAVEARGDRFQVSFDGRPVIDAKDDTFKDGGRVGVWTKADSVTYYDALSARSVP